MDKAIINDIKARIDGIKAEAASDIATLETARMEARKELAEIESMMEEYKKSYNAEAYAEAQAEAGAAQRKINFYNERLAEIRNRKKIEQEEHTRTIKALLDYERELDGEFKERLRVALSEVAEVMDDYKKDLSEAESLIYAWANNVHDITEGERARDVFGIMPSYPGCAIYRKMLHTFRNDRTIHDFMKGV